MKKLLIVMMLLFGTVLNAQGSLLYNTQNLCGRAETYASQPGYNNHAQLLAFCSNPVTMPAPYSCGNDNWATKGSLLQFAAMSGHLPFGPNWPNPVGFEGFFVFALEYYSWYSCNYPVPSPSVQIPGFTLGFDNLFLFYPSTFNTTFMERVDIGGPTVGVIFKDFHVLEMVIPNTITLFGSALGCQGLFVDVYHNNQMYATNRVDVNIL